MHAYLLIGNESETELLKLLNSSGSERIDFTLNKIVDVRELNKFTSLKLPKNTAIVINNFEEASEEAQNAFLKSLEEPQENLTYILIAKTTNNILPTILSRTRIIEVQNPRIKSSKENIELTKEFLEGDTRKRLALTSKIKTREEALSFLNDLIIGGASLLNGNMEHALFLEKTVDTMKALKLNGNVQLQLTNLAINMN